jgi:XRE family aerobic/anaerobic benzoate catabolism transcriptional regulator
MARKHGEAAMAEPAELPAEGTGKLPFLVALGDRIRNLRARRGLTRKAMAQAAGISERHFANLELGTGNASILVLQQVAQALQCSLAEILGDATTSSPEWLLIRELLDGRSDADLHRARLRLAELFGSGGDSRARLSRISLVGLRGAGKSTLGRMLAEDLGYPFIELSREIEKVAGCSIVEIHSLYGTNAYRRYERRALEETIQIYPEVVIATPGGLVSDAATFNLLLSHCYTVWLQAEPEDHMKRVVAQGDFRPMSGSKEAMDDLKRILSGRAAFYSKADLQYHTSGHSLEEAFAGLRSTVRNAAGLPDWAA